MTLKTRLSKLEKTERQIVTQAECICFLREETPNVELRVDMEAVAAETCPIHGKQFKNSAGRVYRRCQGTDKSGMPCTAWAL